MKYIKFMRFLRKLSALKSYDSKTYTMLVKHVFLIGCLFGLYISLLCILFVPKFADASNYSKREVYEKFCFVSKYSVSNDQKKLSRREIWALCTGNSKYDAPKLKRESKESYNPKPKDWILYNNHDYTEDFKEAIEASKK